jgi:hypothetical protein
MGCADSKNHRYGRQGKFKGNQAIRGRKSLDQDIITARARVMCVDSLNAGKTYFLVSGLTHQHFGEMMQTTGGHVYHSKAR